MSQPSDIANLALWFRATDLAGLSDGAAVSSWTSFAGTSVASQATGGFQPTKQTVNGKPCVRFDGSDDRLSLSGDALTFSQNVAGATVFLRVKLNAVPSVGGMFGVSINGGTGARILMRIASNLYQIGGRRLDANSFLAIGTARAQTAALATLSGVLDYANSDEFMWLDSIPVGVDTAFQTSGNSENLASSNAFIGCSPDSLNFTNMDLYEVIVYSRALTTVERQEVETYLVPPSAYSAIRCNVRII